MFSRAITFFGLLLAASFTIPLLVKAKNIKKAASTDENAWNPKRDPRIAEVNSVPSCSCTTHPCLCSVRRKVFLGSTQKPFSQLALGGGER